MYKIMQLLLLINLIFMLPTQAQTYDVSHFKVSGKGKNKPFVVVIPGSGGRIPSHWVSAAVSAGYGVVAVDLGGIFGRPLYSISESTMAGAVAQAIQVGKDVGFDANRAVLLGQSKGGTVAMIASSNIRSAGLPAPKAVLAFYPGSMGACPLSIGGETKVHIFYGDADDWGNFRGTRQACASRAGGNVVYHEFVGAHHGFDGSGAGSFICCGGEFRYQGNSSAAAKARGIVNRVLTEAK